jgi:hypothetical protein
MVTVIEYSPAEKQPSGCREHESAREAGIFRMQLGPLSDDMLMSMAALTTEYHPLKLFAETALNEGLPDLRLHEAWIGGLVDLALKNFLRGMTASVVSISFVRHVYRTDTLVLEVLARKDCQPEESTVFHFKVTNQKRSLIAQGTAHCSPAT